ncbi:hypothetical protein [Streptomyces decoyicus]
MVRTLDELVGLQYSNSYSAPALLGERRTARETLLFVIDRAIGPCRR